MSENQTKEHRPNLLIQDFIPLEEDELHDVSPIPLSQNVTTHISDTIYDFEDDDEDDDEVAYIGSNFGKYSHGIHISTSSSDDDMSDESLNSSMALENALKKDHIVQDVQISNPRILKIFQEPENLLQLLKYVSEPHYIQDPTVFNTSDYSDEELNRYLKYPYLAQQIFLVQHYEINPRIVQSETNLKQLFQFIKNLDSKKTLFNPLLPQIYTKTMSTLLKEFFTQIVNYMMNDNEDEILRSMILNIETPEMHTLILKLLGYESQEESVLDGWRDMLFIDHNFEQPDKEVEECKLKVKKWALDNGFVKHILEKLRLDLNNYNAHENLFNLLEVIIDTDTVLSQEILNKNFIGNILDLALANTETSLYEYTMGFLESIFNIADKSPSKCEIALATIFEKTNVFIQLLDKIPSSSIYTSHGKVDPPLGSIRLLIVKHIAMLYESKLDASWIQNIDHTVLSKLVSLFFQYPFNNLLHFHCCRIFKTILESENDEAILYLLSHAQLLKLIFATLKKEFDVPVISAVGFMGYLVIIGNSRPQAMESPQIDQFVKSFEEWKTFSEFVKEETKKQHVLLGDSY